MCLSLCITLNTFLKNAFVNFVNAFILVTTTCILNKRKYKIELIECCLGSFLPLNNRFEMYWDKPEDIFF